MANQRGRKKSVAADTKSLYEIRFEKRWMNCAGFTWSFMEMTPCLQNYVTR